MVNIDAFFLKIWREKYRWPFNSSRTASEERILQLERLVSENILNEGPYTWKHVLSEIVDWKTSGRQVTRFAENDLSKIRLKVNSILEILHSDPDEVAECIRSPAIDDKLKGVRIPVASTFLRFLDPVRHRYGIIDRNIAGLLNKKSITDFEFENGLLANTYRNAGEYQKSHFWFQKKAGELADSTFNGIDGVLVKWAPVDVEMALFAFCTQQSEPGKNEVNLDSEKERCPWCGSLLVWRTAKKKGERYRGCTNYPACKYNERSY